MNILILTIIAFFCGILAGSLLWDMLRVNPLARLERENAILRQTIKDMANMEAMTSQTWSNLAHESKRNAVHGQNTPKN